MTTDPNARIEQWEKMTREAPDDMAWFSLGNAYRDAGRQAEAADALAKAIEANPQMSRAYQLRAQALIELGRNEEAVATLTAGFTVAASKGDVMPQRAMESLLGKLGAPVPAVAKPVVPPTEQGGEARDQVLDRKTGQLGTKLPDPPMRGALGHIIFENVSLETWRQWIGQGTKVINELRLDFSSAAHQKIYDQHMMEWLGISEDEIKEYPAKSAK